MATAAVLTTPTAVPGLSENVANGAQVFGRQGISTKGDTESDIVAILGPGDDAQDLSSLGENYSSTINSFNGLLQFPFLENMVAKISDPEKPVKGPDAGSNNNGAEDIPIGGGITTGETEIKNLRVFINDALGQFNVFCGQDTSVAQNIISYGGMIRQLLLKKRVPAIYITMVEKLIEKNGQDVAAKAGNKKRVLTKLAKFLLGIKTVIARTRTKLGSLISKIEDEQSSIENDNILDTLVSLLEEAFAFAKDTKSKGLQVSGLIDLTTNITDGPFKEKLKKREERQKLISALSRLEGSLRQLVALLDRLQASLPKTIEATQKLSGVWAYCEKNIPEAKKYTKSLEESEIDDIVRAWGVAAEAAQTLKSGITGADVKGMKAMSFGTKALAEPNTFPTTDAELAAMSAIDESHGGKVPIRYFLRVSSRPAVAKRLKEKLARDLSNATNVDPELAKKAKEALSPPETTEALESLSKSTSGMIKKFNEMLQTPFLSSITVANPWKAGPKSLFLSGSTPRENNLLKSLNIDSQEGEPDKVALDELIRKYQEDYSILQRDTLPVARNLISFSTVQINLIPKLVTNDAGLLAGGGMTIEKYIKINTGLVTEQKAAVDGLVDKMLKFQNDWQNAINSLKAALAEQSAQLEKAEDELKRLAEEQKSKTIWGCLELVGAIVCFAAAALIPGVGLLAAGAGVGLLTKSIKDLVEAKELGKAIQYIKDSMNVANKTKEALNIIIPQAELFLASLKGITKIWVDVAQHLNDIVTYIISKELLDGMRDEVVESWISIQRLVKEYTDIIAGKSV